MNLDLDNDVEDACRIIVHDRMAGYGAGLARHGATSSAELAHAANWPA